MLSRELNPDARVIADYLATLSPGDTITHADLSELIGRDIRSCRYIWLRAARIAQEEQGALFVSVRKVGYRRRLAEETPRVGLVSRTRIRRIARRGINAMDASLARANDMSNETRRKVYQEQTHLHLIDHISRERSLPPLPTTATRPPPITIAVRSLLEHLGVVEPAP